MVLTSLLGFAQKAPKSDAGKLTSYVHSYTGDPMQPFDRDYTYSLTRIGSKGLLTVSYGSEEKPAIEVNDSVFQKAEEMINDGRLYETDKAKAKWMKKHPATAHSSESIMISFEGDKKRSGTVIPPDEHRAGIQQLDNYLAKVYKDQTKRIPDGDMIYCSCAVRHFGLPAGEIQREFYELIADKGKDPKVVHGVERDDEVEKAEFPATAEDVSKLYKMLSDMNVIRISGYRADDRMVGGMSYRVYMEFSSGEKLNASWYTQTPNPLAEQVFNTIDKQLRELAK